MDTGQDTQSYSKHKGIKIEISSKFHPANVKETGIGNMILQSSVWNYPWSHIKRFDTHNNDGRTEKTARKDLPKNVQKSEIPRL
jgi:hypothetical protein